MLSETTEVTRQHAASSMPRGLLLQALGLVLIHTQDGHVRWPRWSGWHNRREHLLFLPNLCSSAFMSYGNIFPLGSPLHEGGHRTKHSIFLLQWLDHGWTHGWPVRVLQDLRKDALAKLLAELEARAPGGHGCLWRGPNENQTQLRQLSERMARRERDRTAVALKDREDSIIMFVNDLKIMCHCSGIVPSFLYRYNVWYWYNT